MLSCDASFYGLGEALLRNKDASWVPVAYTSRTLSSAEQRHTHNYRKGSIGDLLGLRKIQSLFGWAGVHLGNGSQTVRLGVGRQRPEYIAY